MADLESPNLSLPYLAAAQAQKHVTHNEALRRLDAFVQVAIEAAGAVTPPISPDEGARYLLGSGATGDWGGQDGKLAVFSDGAWWFAEPAIGWLVFDRDADALKVRKAGGWEAV